MRSARLLFPDLRAADDGGFEHQENRIRRCLDLGVGGFILFGGRSEAVADLTRRLRAESGHAILVGADLERGAGQQFSGLTGLPPLAALGALDDLLTTYNAGRVTAAEARSVGVDWIFAPVADLDVEPDNPIVGTRSFGAQAERVARQVTAWILGCRAGGALACPKHFPGHGRTTADSHLVLPTVREPLQLLAEDLIPFAAAVEARAPTIMTAHVAFHALDPSGVPATLSEPILGGLLRGRLGFDGLVVSDAMNMGGVQGAAGPERSAGVAALAAGVDALLHPDDPEELAGMLEAAGGSELSTTRVADALARVGRAAALAASLPAAKPGDARAWASAVARRAVSRLRGCAPALAGSRVRLRVVDDDAGSVHPTPARDVFPAALRRMQVALSDGEGANDGARTVLAVYCEPRGWKGRPGLSPASEASVRQVLAEDQAAVVVLFGHPRLATAVPGAQAVVAAWGGEGVMQEAAAAWLAADG